MRGRGTGRERECEINSRLVAHIVCMVVCFLLFEDPTTRLPNNHTQTYSFCECPALA